MASLNLSLKTTVAQVQPLRTRAGTRREGRCTYATPATVTRSDLPSVKCIWLARRPVLLLREDLYPFDGSRS